MEKYNVKQKQQITMYWICNDMHQKRIAILTQIACKFYSGNGKWKNNCILSIFLGIIYPFFVSYVLLITHPHSLSDLLCVLLLEIYLFLTGVPFIIAISILALINYKWRIQHVRIPSPETTLFLWLHNLYYYNMEYI